MSKKQSQPNSTSIVKHEPSKPDITIEQVIQQAVDKGVAVETMERLLAMRRELKQERAKEEYDIRMAAFQMKCPTIRKTKIVYEKDGRRVRYRYAPIESIVEQTKELIQRRGFSYTIDAEKTEGGVKAICKVTHKGGHSETSSFEVPINESAYMSDAQKAASALTFAKRYAFCNAFGILTSDEDDDSQTSAAQLPERPKMQPYRVERKQEVQDADIVPEPESLRTTIKELLDDLGVKPLTQASAIESIRSLIGVTWWPGRNDSKIADLLRKKKEEDPVAKLGDALNHEEKDN